jgi:pimeloyl-ACP methyl ester carboxylesterase
MAFFPSLYEGSPESRTVAIVATTVVTTVALLSLARTVLYPWRPQIIKGPLDTQLAKLSAAQTKALLYTPDQFPGARDVKTPYGSIHVFEFGPEDGRKVLLIHGISTPCITLTAIAEELASKGCRVMLYDLFGRGFTDGVGDLPMDPRLFVTQVLLVLASSHLSWAGDDGFSIIGYSLGGGIAVNFAAAFPHMVKSLILLAPAGMIRPENFGRLSRLIFTAGVIPEGVLAALTKRRLRAPIGGSVAKRPKLGRRHSMPAQVQAKINELKPKESFVDVAVDEAIDTHNHPDKADDDTEKSTNPMEARVASLVHWMLDFHDGFVPAFMSTIRFGPLMFQQESWREVAKRKPGTTAIILGRQDELIQLDDYKEDVLPMFGGKDNVFWRVVKGGHNFPFTNSEQALEVIYEFWGMPQSS